MIIEKWKRSYSQLQEMMTWTFLWGNLPWYDHMRLVDLDSITCIPKRTTFSNFLEHHFITLLLNWSHFQARLTVFGCYYSNHRLPKDDDIFAMDFPKWPHFENPIVKTITRNKIIPVLLSHLNKNSIYASATTIDFIAFIWATNNDVDNFFLSMWICLNKRVYKLLTKGHIFSSCERRYGIEHCNFGSFSRHFLCPSRKHCSVSVLLLMSDITRPNKNICTYMYLCTLLFQVHLMTFVLKGHQRAE